MRALRKSRFVLAATIAALFVGCGGSAAPKTAPSLTPSIDASATASPATRATPGPSTALEPTPTAAITLVPSPAATPFVGQSLVKVAKLPNTAPARIKSEVEAAYAANSKAEGIWREDVALRMISEAQFGTPGNAARYLQVDRLSAAQIGVSKLYCIYIQTRDTAFYSAALDLYGYAMKHIADEYQQEWLRAGLVTLEAEASNRCW
jgi:hypothetical protein